MLLLYIKEWREKIYYFVVVLIMDRANKCLMISNLTLFTTLAVYLVS